MKRTTRCYFCNKVILDEDFAEEMHVEGGCDCSGYREHYRCHKSGCSNSKAERSNYCWGHENCCQESYCEKKATLGGYCSSHTTPCKVCGGRNYVRDDRLCDRCCCNAYGCRKEVRGSERYCSNHIEVCSYCHYGRISQYK